VAVSAEQWEYIGELGVDAATVALWDEEVFPVSYGIEPGGPRPSPPAVLVSVVGDDIDAGVQVNPDGDVVRRPGRWRAEELYWCGDLEAVCITWLDRLPATNGCP
jgi:hypothetical protein